MRPDSVFLHFPNFISSVLWVQQGGIASGLPGLPRLPGLPWLPGLPRLPGRPGLPGSLGTLDALGTLGSLRSLGSLGSRGSLISLGDGARRLCGALGPQWGPWAPRAPGPSGVSGLSGQCRPWTLWGPGAQWGPLSPGTTTTTKAMTIAAPIMWLGNKLCPSGGEGHQFE